MNKVSVVVVLASFVLLISGNVFGAERKCVKKKCSELTRCEEACYLLVKCGFTTLDRDRDGIPCEKICSLPCNKVLKEETRSFGGTSSFVSPKHIRPSRHLNSTLNSTQKE